MLYSYNVILHCGVKMSVAKVNTGGYLDVSSLEKLELLLPKSVEFAVDFRETTQQKCVISAECLDVTLRLKL